MVPYLTTLSRSRLTLGEAKRSVTEVVWPTLDYLVRHYATPESFLNKWSSRFTHSHLASAKVCSSSISHQGFWTLLGSLSFSNHCTISMFAEPIIQINSSRTHWSSSTRSRILEFAQTGLRDPLSFLKRTHLEPFSALIPFADRHGIHLQRNPHPLNSSTPPTPLIPIIHAHSEHWPTAQTVASHSDPTQILLYCTYYH